MSVLGLVIWVALLGVVVGLSIIHPNTTARGVPNAPVAAESEASR